NVKLADSSNEEFSKKLEETIDAFFFIIYSIKNNNEFDEEGLKKVSHRFLDLLKKRRDIPELYYFLALIFCMFNKPVLAREYYFTGMEKFPSSILFKNDDNIRNLTMGV